VGFLLWRSVSGSRFGFQRHKLVEPIRSRWFDDFSVSVAVMLSKAGWTGSYDLANCFRSTYSRATLWESFVCLRFYLKPVLRSFYEEYLVLF
jgi:hypothetical protein